MIRIPAIALCLLLGACAAPYKPANHLPEQTREGEAIQSGIVIGSITAGSRYMNVRARFESTDGQAFFGTVESLDDFGDSAREYPLRYANVFGDVFVIRVPVGNYAFTEWQMAAPGTMQQSPDSLRPLAFAVNPGEAVYLGNIHFPQLATRNAEGPSIPTETWAITNNRELRDADVVYEQQPELKNTLINRRPLDGTVWRADYQALNGNTIADPMH